LGQDEEPFSLDALERYFLEDSLLDDGGPLEAVGEVRAGLAARAERLAREGVLPIGLIGRKWQDQLIEGLVPVRTAWIELNARFPHPAPKLPVHLQFSGAIALDDWIDQLRRGADGEAWLTQISSKVLDKEGAPRGDKLIDAWLRQLAAAAAGHEVTGCLVARDAVVTMAPLDPDAARVQLHDLVALWRRNLDRPLPTACKTALSMLRGGDARSTYQGGFEISGEVDDLCLARLWPDFAALTAGGDWAGTSQALYGPLADWIDQHVTAMAHAREQA
jgi:exodeoxyribonuclease V gamma subunit